jgi:hypothetical protein
VELQEAFVVGSDLAATLSWSSAIAPPPAGARLKLLDSQGLEVGSVSFTPLAGSQTVWIPGGALPRAGTSEGWPLERQIEVLSEPQREILIEKGISVNYNGPVEILAPRWPLPLATGRTCYLYLDSLTCHDPEDKGGDETYLDVEDEINWYAPSTVNAGDTFNFNSVFLLCDTCQDLRKTIKFNLWDLDDPGFPIYDNDDFLGSGKESGCSPVEKTTTYQGQNYTYWLKYHVVCYEVQCP